MRMLYKLKACETKSVVSAILNLETCIFTNNENTGHARFTLNNSSDKLLLECLNQITTVQASLNVGNNCLITNESRYLWKLNPNLKINKIRLKLLRILKPLGLLFTVRNIHTRRYLILNKVEFKTFKIKWQSLYDDLPFNVLVKNNNYIILIDDNFKNILLSAIDKYIICDTPEREILKRNLIEDTLTKLNYLISLPS